MNLILLTSSRADYGIYRPLLRALAADDFFTFRVIPFGTHLSRLHGYTIREIEQDGFPLSHPTETQLLGDSPEIIARSMGLTTQKFSEIWAELGTEIDLVFALGDRYEMLAAVLATVPFGLPVAHLHGGETTLGAIDNAFRHSLTHIARYHFPATERAARRVAELRGSDEHVYPVGALALDNVRTLPLLSTEEFRRKFGVDLSVPTVLFTFHPETVAFGKNAGYLEILLEVLRAVPDPLLITLPNADTMGDLIRDGLLNFARERPDAHVVDSLGTQGYFTALRECRYVLGNSSSGILEAASFRKYVVNVGDRQLGREAGENVLHVPIDRERILEIIAQIPSLPPLSGENWYGDGHTAERIVKILKNLSLSS
jgi:GDP/UDP-N,N'-diacetylbacillosamine 2-epimerase (hydrolysing)